MNYTAVVPVAGSGTRLRPHTYTYPKVLLRVGDKPILGHIVDKLINIGVRDIVFVIGYLGEKVKNYIRDNYSKKINPYFVVQENQLGLGHAVWLAIKDINTPVLVILGDTIIDADMEKFLDYSVSKIGIREVDDPKRFGIVKLKGDWIIDMIEKPDNPPTNLAIAGIYSFVNSSDLYLALDDLIKNNKTTKGEYQLTDAIRIMIKNGHKIKAITVNGWYDCGKPQTLLATNKFILQTKKLNYKIKGSVIIPPVYISKKARIISSIIGPYVSIADEVEVENSIISSTIINDGAVIKNSNLINSIIGPNATVSGRSYSINVGENSEIKMDDRFSDF